MNFYAPLYYKDFKCIADKCSHSCCIGWEIDIDGDSLEKYSALSCDYKTTIIDSIDTDPVPRFRLSEDERCPHLCKNGLCDIINNLGEGYLCHICREHPRFYLSTNYGMEIGLGMACEEACRIILSSDEYDLFEIVGNDDGEICTTDFDALVHRQRLFSLLKSPMGYDEKLHYIYEEYIDLPKVMEKLEADELFSSLEYLDNEHKALFSTFSLPIKTPKHLEKPLERALAYFIFRHCTDASNPEEFCAALGFALFCERLLCYTANKVANTELCARIISEELEYSQENTEAIKELFL